LWHICSRQELWSQLKQPLLGNSSINMPIARQQIRNTQQLSNCEMAFSTQSMWCNNRKTVWRGVLHAVFAELYNEWLTPRPAAISHQPPPLLTAVSRLSCNRSCFSLCSLGMDYTENTTYKRSSIVACASAEAITYQQPLLTEPLPSTGCCIDDYFAAVTIWWMALT
jgi:hypothetical protein